ncbi:MAG: Glutamyl-tRNA(Gln) amidotransferase subunit C [Chlamydiae bacterium]|nr:Glutamyl-tRNA(Gln) amidotransferase subunit C [Chlamydiota bacterium]
MISEDEFERLVRLCRIALSKDEKEKLQTNLKNIVGYIDALQSIDTTNVDPCVHVVEGHSLPLRADEVGPVLEREEFLANSPSHVGGMVKVPAIMKPEE